MKALPLEDTWERFTLRGSDSVEAEVRNLVRDAAYAVRELLPENKLRSLVLLGGFGRGEGGVIVEDGVERPHNNLDFLLITRGVPETEQRRLHDRMRAAFRPLTDRYQIEFDTSVIADTKLERATNLIIWYDMRHGHRTLLGDPDYVPYLPFTLERIPGWDMRNLLVNRGTLLVINAHLLVGELDLNEDMRRLVVKHIMKALIGYGDALLFFLGAYHWSYAERQRRMAQRKDVSEAFRRAYDDAMNFRFSPDYAAYLEQPPEEFLARTIAVVEPVHLRCESLRLDCELASWDAYPAGAFRRELFDDAASPRAWAKKAVYTLRASATPPADCLDAAAGLGFRAAGPRNRMVVLFPAVLYSDVGEKFHRLAAEALGAADTTTAELRRAYLTQWGRHGDANFASALRKWDLDLDRKMAPAPGVMA